MGKLSIENCQFIDNKARIGSAIYTAHGQDYPKERSIIIVDSCTFKNNSG